MLFQDQKISLSNLTTNSVSLNWENPSFNRICLETQGCCIISSRKVEGLYCVLKYLKDDTVYKITLKNDNQESTIEVCTLANPPNHLRISNVQDNSVTVEWSCGGHLKASTFIIEILNLKSEHISNVLYHEFIGEPVLGKICFHYNVYDLFKNTEYFVSIKRKNQFGVVTDPVELVFKTKCGLYPIPLVNSKLNCYQNSVFQALSSCDKFKEVMHDLLRKDSANNRLNTFSFILKYLEGNYRYHDVDFQCIDLSENPLFHNWNKYYGQQDCFEFLSYIVNYIFEGFLRNTKYRIPMQLFQQHHILCMCGKEDCFSPVQTNLALHVTVPKDHRVVNLQSLVDSYFSPTPIDYYECDQTGCESGNNKGCKIIKLVDPLPRTICIQLQRTFWNGHFMELNNTRVKFHEFLDIKKAIAMHENNCNTIKYALKSVIVYLGDADIGHYVCFRRLVDTWFVTDDIFSSPVSDEQLFGVEPYVLFYESVDV